MHLSNNPRYSFEVRHSLIILALSIAAFAADFQDAKIVEFHDASQVGAATVNSINPVGPISTDVPALSYRCYLTVEMDGVKYSAIFPVNEHFKIAELNAGDIIPARLAGNKLLIRTPDGKEMKSKIVERSPSK